MIRSLKLCLGALFSITFSLNLATSITNFTASQTGYSLVYHFTQLCTLLSTKVDCVRNANNANCCGNCNYKCTKIEAVRKEGDRKRERESGREGEGERNTAMSQTLQRNPRAVDSVVCFCCCCCCFDIEMAAIL